MVSVRITRITITMEMMAAGSKVGSPNANGRGSSKIAPVPTLEKSAMPTNAATTVPMTMASRIDSREMTALPSLLRSMMITSVSAARPRLAGEP
ncbi:hypothetical protein GCM10027449_17870 [Sinomonas notoginsengisoli]